MGRLLTRRRARAGRVCHRCRPRRPARRRRDPGRGDRLAARGGTKPSRGSLVGAGYEFANSRTVSGEVYLNGAGVGNPARYDVRALLAGRIQSRAKRYAGLATAYDVTPLLTSRAHGVVNLDDHGGVLWPEVEYSVTGAWFVSVGVQWVSGGRGANTGDRVACCTCRARGLPLRTTEGADQRCTDRARTVPADATGIRSARAWRAHCQSRARRSSWALSATITVLADMSTAPTAGCRTIPHVDSTPAASGIAATL